MTTEDLHQALLAPLGNGVLRHSSLKEKPLTVDLAPPLPPTLRVYMYTLVGGVGTVRPTEYKSVLRVPGQRQNEYESFEHSGGVSPCSSATERIWMYSCYGMPACIRGLQA